MMFGTVQYSRKIQHNTILGTNDSHTVTSMTFKFRWRCLSIYWVNLLGQFISPEIGDCVPFLNTPFMCTEKSLF